MRVFIGYSLGKKGWKFFDMEREEIIISRDVVFREDVFPFSEKVALLPSTSSSTLPDDDWAVTPTIVDRGSADTTSSAVETMPQPTVSASSAQEP